VHSNPNQIVEQSLLLVEKLPQFRNISINKKLGKDMPNITCDTRQLQQVILNLMLNAVDSMKEIGEIDIFTEYDKEKDKCIFGVKDNGPGVNVELGNKIFEPFFSTKGTNGLGLAVSWGIVERHFGTIEYENVPDGGAIFKIILPAYKKPIDT
jgi:two-component system NtrC family sensor kinase